MFKKKIKTISLIIILTISLFTPIVNAENETTNEAVPINETQESVSIKEGDEYLFQDTVNIDTPIDGNLFIFANTVTINSQIGGDAFICANTINIEKNAYIYSNVFACASTINVKGVVYDIYSISNSLTIDGFVYRDVKSMCDTLNINSMIGRNVFANCSSINFKEKPDTEDTPSIASYGTIQGNLNYSSDEEIQIPKDAVSGETHFTSLAKNIVSTTSISGYMYSLGATLASATIIWLLSLWITPKFLHNKNTSMTLKKVLQIIGLGILTPIIITLLGIIILLIPITSQLMILLLCILAILFFISTSVAIINLNTMICNKLKITQNLYKLGFLIITAIVFWLLTLIPYVGFVISVLATIWGIGSISYGILVKEKADEKNTNSDKELSVSEEKKEKKEITSKKANDSGKIENENSNKLKKEKTNDASGKTMKNKRVNKKEEQDKK